MRMIQVASDKEIGVWYFDKQEQKLIGISQSTMLQVNSGENIPVVGITAGLGSILVAVGTYLTKQGVCINYKALIAFICINILCSYIYTRHYVRKVAEGVKQIGRQYEVCEEILQQISRAGVKVYVSLSIVTGFMIAMTALCIFLYLKTQSFVMILTIIVAIDTVTMLIVTLHPLQKILFWVKVRKLY